MGGKASAPLGAIEWGDKQMASTLYGLADHLHIQRIARWLRVAFEPTR